MKYKYYKETCGGEIIEDGKAEIFWRTTGDIIELYIEDRWFNPKIDNEDDGDLIYDTRLEEFYEDGGVDETLFETVTEEEVFLGIL